MPDEEYTEITEKIAITGIREAAAGLDDFETDFFFAMLTLMGDGKVFDEARRDACYNGLWCLSVCMQAGKSGRDYPHSLLVKCLDRLMLIRIVRTTENAQGRAGSGNAALITGWYEDGLAYRAEMHPEFWRVEMRRMLRNAIQKARRQE